MKFKNLICVLLLSTGCAVKDKTGPMGPPGVSGGCSVSQLANGVEIECNDGSYAIISNGQDGINGLDGTNSVSPFPADAYYVVGYEDLCGAGASEILLRLNDGRLIAHYSHGNQQYLTFVGEGNWTSTDGASCQFHVGPAPGYTITY